jgi:mono/diheme cytochrome c family protein
MNLRWSTLAPALFILAAGLLACDYGRMKDQEALQTYETPLPEMPGRSIPVTGGIQIVKETPPENLSNPLPQNQEVLDRGKAGYGNYCVMCHGPKFNGNGTVGQSFSPLPTNLKDPYVQDQSDGRLFYTITFGLKRHPGLGFMITENNRWAIVHYIRSLR